jgi:glycosyltransferase involved in cell wall biosynthesis
MLEPLVSVCCTAYNHEKYIRDAIEGFLSQKTDFPFEVLIHDDASIDRTTDIITEYADKYNKLIRPIYQKENQYSQGKKVMLQCVIPKASGKYIALCEGDDYWIDPYKLQKQVDFLESNNDYVVCGHGFIVKDIKKINKEKRMFAYDPTKYGSFRYFRALKGSPLFTNTLLFQSKAIIGHKYLALMGKYPAGDDFLMLVLMSAGKGYCLPEFMSVYRVNDSSTWSSIKPYIKKLRMFVYQMHSFEIIPFRYYIVQFMYIVINLSDALIGLFRIIIKKSDFKVIKIFKSEILKINYNMFLIVIYLLIALFVMPLRVIMLVLKKIFLGEFYVCRKDIFK